ncbi:MAG: helix-turn-helix transcriptional regulator [Gemmatimonadota bacterium]
MAERETARERLERVLYILPAAAKEGGVTLEEAERALGVPRERIVADVREVIARDYYHPAGGAETLQISLEHDRISVWTGSGDFSRPVRLSPGEALGLGLAPRARAGEAEGERRDALLALARRLESELALASPEDVLPRFGIGEGVGAGDGLRALFRASVRDRTRCRIRYLKRGGDSPDDRVVCPYSLVFAEGFWYLIAYCTRVEDVRVFRLDRVLETEPVGDGEDEAGYELPDDFDAAEYVSSGGRLYYADDDVEAVVRYSSTVAGWIAERWAGGGTGGAEGDGEIAGERVEPGERLEWLEDGGVVVRHRVADPRWLVRHVLQYGPNAEVLEPEELRGLVAAAAVRTAERAAQE